MKYIVVTGGVISGVGKNIVSCSLGVILQSRGYEVTLVKIDPYVNLDAKMLTPYEYDEIYVLDDGGEIDSGLGNYERFLDIVLTSDHSITIGKIYGAMIERERSNFYSGKIVQILPNVTDLIQECIVNVSQKPIRKQKTPDICIIELGGTIGDVESNIFAEALRQLKSKLSQDNFLMINIPYIIDLPCGQQKTKPAQNSFSTLRMLGLAPDIVIGRCRNSLSIETIKKISIFAGVSNENVFSLKDHNSLYEVPSMLNNQNIFLHLKEHLKLDDNNEILNNEAIKLFDGLSKVNFNKVIKIAIVGKYTEKANAYISIVESIRYSSFKNSLGSDVVFINAEDLQNNRSNAWDRLKDCDGIIIAGGFGNRGVEGKILTAQYARENNVPFLGICLGFQVAVIEFCRNVLGLEDCNSEEINEDAKNKVIIPIKIEDSGFKAGSMRLGTKETKILKNSKIFKYYRNNLVVFERHRHSYGVNPSYISLIENKGMIFVGKDEKNQLIEIFELKDHIFYIGTQYHPELLSRVNKPHPIFEALINTIKTIDNRSRKNK